MVNFDRDLCVLLNTSNVVTQTHAPYFQILKVLMCILFSACILSLNYTAAT